MINKKEYKKDYFEDNKPFDPLDIALNNLRQFNKRKLQEKYDLTLSNYPNLYCNKSFKISNYSDLFFGYFDDVSLDKDNDEVKISQKDEDNKIISSIDAYTDKNIKINEINNNNKYNEKKIENRINIKENDVSRNNNKNINIDTKAKSVYSLKRKLFFNNLQIYHNIHSIKKNKDKKRNERQEIRKKYLIAKKKLEESYFNREKFYYMEHFSNFPFVKYIYRNNKKNYLNPEKSLYSANKYLKKQKRLDNFLKKLNSETDKNRVLFSKSVIREAGYFSKNNTYKKIISRNNQEKNCFYKTDHTNNTKKYDLDVCFLKHIDFPKINKNVKKLYIK